MRERLPAIEGEVLDVGCGNKPYAQWTQAKYVGLGTSPDTRADVLVKAGDQWPLAAATIDTVLCTQVLEHVMHEVKCLSEDRARSILPRLVALLQDSVQSGSSVGFLPPLTFEAAKEYWLETLNEVAQGKRILLVSSEAGDVTGTVQLALATRQNGLHRAEVQKLIVHTSFRNCGIARALMGAVEESARAAGRALLVLDTEQGSIAEKLYEKCGYTRAGVIPQYARSVDGSLISTVLFYKLL